MGRLVERSDLGLAALESRKCLDLFSDLLFGETQFVEAMKVQPKLRAGSEEMCETQSGVPCNSALAVKYFGDAVGRDTEVARKLGGAHAAPLSRTGPRQSDAAEGEGQPRQRAP